MAGEHEADNIDKKKDISGFLDIRLIYSNSHTCEVHSFLVLGVRSSEFGVRSYILGVPHESEKRYIAV